MARRGLAKTFEGPFYTEYTDYAGSGCVLRTMKMGAAAGQQNCMAPGIGSFAQMLAATDLLGFKGAEFVTTDAGYSRVRWTPNSAGTAWRPVNGTALLASVSGKYANPLQTVTGTGVANQIVFAAQPLLLANMLQPNTALHIRAHVRKNGTNAGSNEQVLMYFGTTGTTSDSALTVITGIAAASTNQDVRIDAYAYAIDSTTLASEGSCVPNNGSAGAVGGPMGTNIDTTQPMKLTMAYKGNTGNTLDLISYSMYIEAP